jgi:DNA-binding MarR family transcriptional regulator
MHKETQNSAVSMPKETFPVNDDGKKNATIRVVHNRENPYILIPKEILKDKNLSLIQKGILCYLLSLTEEEGINPVRDAKALGITDKEMQSNLKKLILNGYVGEYE